MPPRSKIPDFRAISQLISLSGPPSRSLSSNICRECRQILRQQRQLPRTTSSSYPSSSRAFSTSPTFQKKSSTSSKSARSSPEVTSPKNKSQPIPDNAATREKDQEIDPYDFTVLDRGIASAIARLKDALTKTRDAGRITPVMVEELPVDLNIKGKETHGTSPHKERTKIGDIASVVPKTGRMLQVYCAEEAHVKPITSALQASSHSLAPQPDAHNALVILIPVPPATAETRAQAKAEAKKCFERASNDIRNARGDAQKRHRKMELGKLVIVDELRKAHKQMEEVVKKGQDEAKKVFEAAVKSLDG